MTLTYIMAATLFGGLVSVLLAAALSAPLLGLIVRHLVSLSTGVLLGTALLHVLPEAFESGRAPQGLFLTLLGGLMFFFLLEKVELYRHNHHHEYQHQHQRQHHYHGGQGHEHRNRNQRRRHVDFFPSARGPRRQARRRPRHPARPRLAADAGRRRPRALAAAWLGLAQEPADNQATLNFVGADIESVVRAIGHYTGNTFVIDPRVKASDL